MTDQTLDLTKKIAENMAQKEEIEGLLKLDPNNPELLGLRDEAQKLIDESEQLLRVHKQQKSKPPPPAQAQSHTLSSTLTAPLLRYTAGQQCLAKWTEDQQWYKAVIESANTKSGTYTVLFPEYGNRDIVPPDHISVSEVALKAEQDLTPIAIPESLKISKEDSAETKAAKKKRIHSIKSKNRFKQMDAATNNKQNDWKSFLTGTSKMKRGVKKKESMFRSPDSVDGRVGVVGSGKGMTEYKDLRKVDSRRVKPTLSLDEPKRH